VLIAGDQPGLIATLAAFLDHEREVEIAASAEAAGARLDQTPGPDIVLLAPEFAGADGFQICLKLKSAPQTWHVPVLFYGRSIQPSDQARALTVGAADILTEPFHPDLVRARIDHQIALKLHREELERLVAQRGVELARTQEAALIAVATLAEIRDPETGGHLFRTQRYVRLLAEEIARDRRYARRMHEETIELLHKSAPLHDIGKVGISDRILLKPGPLTAEEFAEVKKHTLYGWNALRSANQRLGKDSFLRFAAEIALTHHERWDGTGYPRGLTGEQIPLSGRLMAFADVYDALISRRVYKKSFSHAKAMRIIAADGGRQFDPALAEAFQRIERTIAAVVLDTEDYAI